MRRVLSRIVLGTAMWLVIALLDVGTGCAMWEDQSPDGNSYLLGWRTALVLSLLMLAAQSVSYVWSRWHHKQSPHSIEQELRIHPNHAELGGRLESDVP